MRAELSSGDLLVLIAVLAAFGIADSAYLAWQWYDAANSTWCDLDPYFSCAKVRESPFSSVAGVPVAFVGVGGFALLLGLAVLGLRGRAGLGRLNPEGWIFAFAVLGTAIAVGLTIIELFVIRALCIPCVLGFALGLGIFVAAILLVRSGT